jgi:hypothetical protein
LFKNFRLCRDNQHKMKAVVTAASLVLFSLTSSGQHSFSSPYNPVFYGSRQLPTGFEAASVKQLYTVVYHDSTTQTIRAEIGDYKGRTFLMIDEPGVSKTIQPKDTKSLIAGTKEEQKYAAIPRDSIWLFKVVSGAINAYSLLPKTDRRFIVGVQKGDDAPIIPLTKENVLVMIETSRRARKLVDEGRLVDAVKAYNGSN